MKEKYRRPQISTVGLVAHYKLWAGLTTTGEVFDYSFGGATGTVTGTDIAPAYPGFSLNNTDDFIDIGTGPSAVNTIVIWARIANAEDTEYLIDLNGDDYLSIVTGTLTKTGFGGGGPTLYVNGVVATSVAEEEWVLLGSSDSVPQNASDLDIGRVGGQGWFNGSIGETMLFGRQLSAIDMKNLYELTRWRYGV